MKPTTINWISVKDRLPKDGDTVFCITTDKEIKTMYVCVLDDYDDWKKIEDYNFWYGEHIYKLKDILYWAEIPEVICRYCDYNEVIEKNENGKKIHLCTECGSVWWKENE